MKQENVDIQVGSKFDAKGFKQAETALNKLSKTVKSAAGALGVAYGARAITRYGIAAAKAFAADDKAAKILTRSLNNLGLAFADPQVKKFISDLELTYGVVDDKLRPAFQRLLTTTGSVAKSQESLMTALDLSAASGIDVVSVAGDLSKAYVGQTRALSKYGLGLSQAQLKAMSFEEVQARINKTFGGQAKTQADSYAGSLDKIAVAAQQAKEIIGQGLVQALGDAAGNGGLAASLSAIIKLATTVNDLFVGLGRTFAAITGAGFGTAGVSPLQAIKNFKKITAEFRRQDAEAARQQSISSLNYGGLTGFQKQYAEAQAKKKQAELLRLQKAQLKIAKEQSAIQKAGTLFDLQQTQIIAALKGNISAEERKRLELQLAILTGNTSEASKLAQELAKSQGLSQQLAAYLASLPDAKNPFSAWKSYLDMIEAQVGRITQGQPAAPVTSMASGYGVTGTQYSLPSGATVATAAGPDITVNVNAGTVIAEEALKDVIRDSLLNDSLQAKFAAIYRQGGLGSFG